MKNLLSRATLKHLYAIDPVSARALEAAGDLPPPAAGRERPVVRRRGDAITRPPRPILAGRGAGRDEVGAISGIGG